MAGELMDDVRRLVLESATDDWISDYEFQGDYQAELALSPAAAYERMVAQAADWIGRGVLLPGDLLDGFVPWQGSPEEKADRFKAQAGRYGVLTRPGQICWFDTGPDAPSELARLGAG
jgi:hypothetical protein